MKPILEDYRIKTKNEFIKEYGLNWRTIGCLSFIYDMDVILGKPLLDLDMLDKNSFYHFFDKNNNLLNNYQLYVHITININGQIRCICSYMITKINKTPNYNEIKKLVYE